MAQLRSVCSASLSVNMTTMTRLSYSHCTLKPIISKSKSRAREMNERASAENFTASVCETVARPVSARFEIYPIRRYR